MKIVIAGSGNVATHLGTGLAAGGHKIIQVISRNATSGSWLSKKLQCPYSDILPNRILKADLYLIAVNDSSIDEVAGKIPYRDRIAIHTSGSIPLKVLSEKFTNAGVLYPVQTFSVKRKLTLRKIPLCIEATQPRLQKKLERLAGSLSRHIYCVSSSQRLILHLAAVLTNNFSNHLFTLASKLLEEHQLNTDLIRPLFLETALKVQKHDPKLMQTGPAIRGDTTVIEKHLELLQKHPGLRAIYQLLTDSIENLQGPRL